MMPGGPAAPRPSAALPAALALLLPLAGCASAGPLLAGGATTPEDRSAVTVGGATRLAYGGARPDAAEGTLPHAAAGQGVVPVAAFRHGVARHFDIGFMAAGTDLRLEGRHEIVLKEAATRPSVLLGAALLGGYADSGGFRGEDRAQGGRMGVEIPVVYAVEFGPVYDLWMGGRLAAEHMRIRSGQAAGHATALRSGLVVGLGAGFRRLHAQLELTAYYERWVGAPDDSGLGGGLVLVPVFALRVKL
jgi:hypothetical protein